MSSHAMRQLAKKIAGAPAAQTATRAPAPLSLTRATVSGVGILQGAQPTTMVQLAGSAVDVAADVVGGYVPAPGAVVEVMVSGPRLIVLGPSSPIGGDGQFPSFFGSGDPNVSHLVEGKGLWYEDLLTGNLWLSAGDGTWAGLSLTTVPGYQGGTVEVMIGYKNSVQTDSDLALAIGYNNIVTEGVTAVAIGSGNNVTGTGIAIGKACTVNGLGSIAIGVGVIVTGSTSVAIGYGASAEFNDSVALGFGATVAAAGQIVLGTGGNRTLIPGLPNFDPHVVNTLWNNGGVVNVSAG
jgi:Head domain of trimeric autotransporter adhesin